MDSAVRGHDILLGDSYRFGFVWFLGWWYHPKLAYDLEFFLLLDVVCEKGIAQIGLEWIRLRYGKHRL